jgi:hypothetical protein
MRRFMLHLLIGLLRTENVIVRFESEPACPFGKRPLAIAAGGQTIGRSSVR